MLRLKDSVYRKKTQLWGEEIQVGKYTLQIFPLLNKFTLLGSFPCDSAGKESACNVRDLGSIPGLGRSPGEGNGYPLEYSGLENSMDCIVHGVAESHTTERLSLHFTFNCLFIWLHWVLVVCSQALRLWLFFPFLFLALSLIFCPLEPGLFV